jgi:hypothetical protein
MYCQPKACRTCIVSEEIAVPAAGFYTFEIRAVAGTNHMVVFLNESFTFYQADF